MRVITNIGDAHLEKLKSRKGVFKEKSALLRHIDQSENGKCFFLNVGDEYLRKHLSPDYSFDTIQYDRNGCPLHHFTMWSNDSEQYLSCTCEIDGLKFDISTSLIGSYNIENIATAFTIGLQFGIDPSDISDAIAKYRPVNMRSQVIETPRNYVILDAYNANPTSMKESIASFLDKSDRTNNMLIIGDMLELGKMSEYHHHNILHYLIRRNVKDVMLVGKIFSSIEQEHFLSFDSVDDLIHDGNLQEYSNRQILIKGSRGIQLEKAIHQL